MVDNLTHQGIDRYSNEIIFWLFTYFLIQIHSSIFSSKSFLRLNWILFDTYIVTPPWVPFFWFRYVNLNPGTSYNLVLSLYVLSFMCVYDAVRISMFLKLQNNIFTLSIFVSKPLTFWWKILIPLCFNRFDNSSIYNFSTSALVRPRCDSMTPHTRSNNSHNLVLLCELRKTFFLTLLSHKPEFINVSAYMS